LPLEGRKDVILLKTVMSLGREPTDCFESVDAAKLRSATIPFSASPMSTRRRCSLSCISLRKPNPPLGDITYIRQNVVLLEILQLYVLNDANDFQ
jgi:hypothetical protein